MNQTFNIGILMEGIPTIPEDLLEYLEKLHPDRSPSITDGERAIWFKAGQVALVRNLRWAFEHQNETILQG